jgi:predicted MFS family arabinose efflux permease
MTFVQTLSAAGFTATVIAFGPARMGYGLFVPEFRAAFSMSSTEVGIVSSIGFSGFVFGLIVAQALLRRRGPEAPVVMGLTAATVGMAIVAIAQSLVMLAIGVFVAASSAGFTWTPFNDAVHRKVADTKRPGALSRISTGASLGIAAAAIGAFAVSQSDLSWRISWAIFAVAGGLSLIVNAAALRQVEKAPDPTRHPDPWQRLLRAQALSLFLVALVLGTTSAIYISFAADQMTRAGGVAGIAQADTAALVFLVYGLCGLAGLFAGALRRAMGLAPLLRAVMLAGAASAALVALMPGSWTGLILSAGMQGVYVMMASAVMAFWSERLYPALPSFGFTVTLLAMAAGSVIGPVSAGFAADASGAGPVFLGSAALALTPALLLRRRHLVERPAEPALSPRDQTR